MKKELMTILVLICGILSGCKGGENTQMSGSYTNPPLYSIPDDNIIYPQTFFVNEIRYDMVIDLNHSLQFELDQLIGHIIHEDMLEQYESSYPNLIPVVNNYMKNSFTNNMIEIYSVKDMDKAQYLALKIIGRGNIIKNELFQAN